MTDEMMDFSEDRTEEKPIKFKIDGEVYECTRTRPAGATRDWAEMAKIVMRPGKRSTEDMIQLIELEWRFLDAVMFSESQERFVKRLRDPEQPISDEQVARIARHLIEVYGDRPTMQPSLSGNGASGIGTNSTAGAPVEE